MLSLHATQRHCTRFFAKSCERWHAAICPYNSDYSETYRAENLAKKYQKGTYLNGLASKGIRASFVFNDQRLLVENIGRGFADQPFAGVITGNNANGQGKETVAVKHIHCPT